MDKMFKRSLLGAAIAMTAVASNANAAIELMGENVVLYGQAAGNLQFWSADASDEDNNVNVEIESRIGIRGKVEYDAMAPAFIYQMETGNADNGGEGNNDGFGAFGGRDTYVGFEFDGIGQIKYGRQLVAAYDYVDYPHTNPGLGNVFDWHNAIDAGFADRANHTIRFDSANWGGVKIQATLSGMNTSTDEMVASIAAGYTGNNFNIHAGYYNQQDAETKVGDKTLTGDISYAIVGGSLNLGDFTLTAAYKPMWNDATDNQQDAYSATVAYMMDQTWVYKIGYAATSDTDKAVTKKINGTEVTTKDVGSQAITGRVMYLLPSTAIYFDVRNYDMLGNDKGADGTRFLFGAEYYF
ncbi:porin [Photobacterium gaetbulicola]|uniref:Putative outer membrane protein n=1 Tax=Photobacterium gaetbulicola Gung47 TaxID=658445 RepID=A0A0C5WR06_9GAMM|nr:porin [Photobacterium gaetbulicola]AJR09598.1 putative outer membrane protein [Photobacterium gaetbulicola Gung47]PSU14392.1 porin [Photobacterium gaetbulicola]